MSDLTGAKLDGRYLLEELVGEGGMADFYRAKDLRDDRTVGVKVLRDEFRDNEELVRRFKNESRAISVLGHENIVKVFDVSVSDKLQYIVMEYIDGITLKEYIEQRGEPLTYKETIHFITQVLKALQHAHDKGIVHRDVKPQNIMLREDGTLKMMDFGIARLARSESHTVSDQAIGSVHYISPEQAKGESTDPRADIYSVGIMMYEMLSGRLPFESDNAVAIAVAQISDQAVPLQQVNRSVPAGLAEITAKAMAKDPRQRYQSALEMLRDVDEFKRDPSVKFDYDYLQGTSPERYIDKVVKEQKRPNGSRPSSSQPQGGKGGRGKGPGGKKKKRRIGLVVPIALGITLAVVGVCGGLVYTMFQNSGNSLFAQYEDVALPDFTGMQYEDVKKMCEASPFDHLRLELKEERNPSVPSGEVITQNPTSSKEKQKMVKANQRIYLTVSQGVKDIAVPDLSGMSRKEAIKEVLELGVRPYAKPVESTDYPAGTVIGTNPAAGSIIQNLPDQIIEIQVASEKHSYDTTVPGVIGQSEAAARNIILSAGLNFGVSSEVFNEQPEGTVVGQTPEGGQVRSRGTTVFVTVSKGPEKKPDSSSSDNDNDKNKDRVKVPGVSGGALNSARKTLEKAGFNVEVNEVYDDDFAAGVVIKQNPSGGSMAKKGSTVTLTVSKGPKPAPEPDPVPDPDSDPVDSEPDDDSSSVSTP